MKTYSWRTIIPLVFLVLTLSVLLSALSSWLTARQFTAHLLSTASQLPQNPIQQTQMADLQATNAALVSEKRAMQDIAATLESELADIRARQRYQYVQQTYTSVPVRRAYVFRMLDEKVGEVRAYSSSATPQPNPPASLPDTLVIPPGDYRFLDQTYRLKKEGLYRFIDPYGENHQRIVFAQDVHALLSAVAWITTHGERDNSLPQAALLYAARTRKLSLTCGGIVGMARMLLDAYGIPSRAVHTFPLQDFDGFDDGHVMLEVYRGDLGHWALYDLDNNLMFTDQKDEQVLTLMELVESLPGSQFSLRSIAADTTLDIDHYTFYGDFDGSLYYEAVIGNPQRIKRWMQESFIPAAIYQEGIFWGFQPGGNTTISAEALENLAARGIHLKLLDAQSFSQRFYAETP